MNSSHVPFSLTAIESIYAVRAGRYALPMALPLPAHRYSEAEYLELERSAEYKSEFFDGEIFAMAGASPQHARITARMIAVLEAALGEKPCAAYSSDLKIKSEATGLITSPDLSIICGPPQFAPGSTEIVINPTALVEVLSDSTEAYDRGAKFQLYRQIPTLREYLLVSQRAPRIERLLRQPDESWVWTEASGLQSSVELPALGLTLPLAEVFAKVTFEPEPLRTPSPDR